jgi:SAM-dependent methyltransferase
MRSRDADRYDLDADAVDYDTRVADEQVLIRRGYAACLRALSEDLSRAPTLDAPTPDALPVTDLGAGTGTLLRALPASCTAVAVDRSQAMLDQATEKLAGRPVTFIHDDLLAYVTEADTPLGHVVSTFALHSLLPDEKSALLTSLAARLAPGARLCIGDLGFADADSRHGPLVGSLIAVRDAAPEPTP